MVYFLDAECTDSKSSRFCRQRKRRGQCSEEEELCQKSCDQCPEGKVQVNLEVSVFVFLILSYSL